MQYFIHDLFIGFLQNIALLIQLHYYTERVFK